MKKKFMALVLTFILVVTFSACGSNADETATTTSTTVATTVSEETTTVPDTTVAETTTVPDATVVETSAEETTRREEYDLYKNVSIEKEDLPVSFSGEVKNASFYYVPYETRTEGDFYFYSILRVEVESSSEETEIYFNGNDNVFPGNMPEAVVSGSGNNTDASYSLDQGANTATMSGFKKDLESVQISFPVYMSAIDMPIGEELYEVSCLQVVFN